jgi:hypothetical protein
VRLRRKYGLQINEAMAHFFQRLGILDAQGEYTARAGDIGWVHYQYCRAKGDLRSEEEIRRQGEEELRRVSKRGVHLSRGFGEHVWNLNPTLKAELDSLYALSKQSLSATIGDAFVAQFGENVRVLTTRANSREEHLNFPKLGECLSDESVAELEKLEAEWKLSLFSRYAGNFNFRLVGYFFSVCFFICFFVEMLFYYFLILIIDFIRCLSILTLRAFLNESPEIQIVVTDGLNANAITDADHLQPYLDAFRSVCTAQGWIVSPQLLFVKNGRVRTGYQIGMERGGGEDLLWTFFSLFFFFQFFFVSFCPVFIFPICLSFLSNAWRSLILRPCTVQTLVEFTQDGHQHRGRATGNNAQQLLRSGFWILDLAALDFLFSLFFRFHSSLIFFFSPASLHCVSRDCRVARQRDGSQPGQSRLGHLRHEFGRA